MAGEMRFLSSTLFLALSALLLLHASPVAAFGAGNIGKQEVFTAHHLMLNFI